jgi:hypothetical protein
LLSWEIGVEADLGPNTIMSCIALRLTLASLSLPADVQAATADKTIPSLLSTFWLRKEQQ